MKLSEAVAAIEEGHVVVETNKYGTKKYYQIIDILESKKILSWYDERKGDPSVSDNCWMDLQTKKEIYEPSKS